MQTKMILRPLPHYWRSFNYSTARIVSFCAWQNSELPGRTSDFLKWIKIFFRKFLLKAHYYPAYYIMVG